jgi:hypothetical protein
MIEPIKSSDIKIDLSSLPWLKGPQLKTATALVPRQMIHHEILLHCSTPFAKLIRDCLHAYLPIKHFFFEYGALKTNDDNITYDDLLTQFKQIMIKQDIDYTGLQFSYYDQNSEMQSFKEYIISESTLFVDSFTSQNNSKSKGKKTSSKKPCNLEKFDIDPLYSLGRLAMATFLNITEMTVIEDTSFSLVANLSWEEVNYDASSPFSQSSEYKMSFDSYIDIKTILGMIKKVLTMRISEFIDSIKKKEYADVNGLYTYKFVGDDGNFGRALRESCDVDMKVQLTSFSKNICSEITCELDKKAFIVLIEHFLKQLSW